MFKSKKSKWFICMAVLMSILMFASACAGTTSNPGASNAPGTGGEKLRLGLVVGDLSNPFFVSVQKGANEAAKALGVDLTVLGSKTLEENVKVSEDMIQTQVDAIAITPFDSKGNIPVVQKANAAKIPIFTIDSKVDEGDVVAYIGTDNVLGGKLAGEWLSEKLGGKGKIAILEGNPGESTNVMRLEGFRGVIDKTQIKVAASVTANWARDKGLKVMSDIIAGNPDIVAVMAMNDEMAIGAMEALKAAKRTDVIVVGYNGAAEAIQNVYNGTMAATVVQYPEVMGKLYVENAVKLLKDKVKPASDQLKPPVQVVDTTSANKAISSITGKASDTPASVSIKATKRYKLGLVVGDLSNPFFVSLQKGANDAAKAAGVDITVLGSKTLEENVKVAEDMIQTQVDAIAITPFDAKGNIPVVQKANTAKIPIFTIDSDVDGGDVVAYIGTDNVLGGTLAGQYMAEKLGGKGKIAILEGNPGESTNVMRLQGFHSVIDTFKDIKVAASVTANWARDKGLKVMSDIIAGNPDIVAVMAMNDEMAIGAMEALKAAKRTDVIVVGYNGAAEAIQDAKNKTMAATVVQYPEVMGQLFVENAINFLQNGVKPATHQLKAPVQVMDDVFLNKVAEAIIK